MNMERYNHFNKWLKQKFGERTLKICIDGGFTCPNRDGKVCYDGCIFCGDRGSGENTKRLDISEQVLNHLQSYRGKRANKFIAYFQNFTNTYDTVKNLKTKYDSALISDKIVALAVATRPDCINDEICNLLSSYKNKYYVYVELGLQTSNNEVGELINRGYTTNQFIMAVNLLNKYNIDVFAHVMIGLPNESEKDLKDTINLINSLKITGIKIHSTYVIKNTKLEKMFIKGEYSPITLEYYVKNVCNAITWLRNDIVIARISGDAPKDLLVAPKWNLHKKIIINTINKKLEDDNIYQGCFRNKE